MTANRFAVALGVARPPPAAAAFISGNDIPDASAVNHVMRFMERRPRLSVVIPTTNESSNLPHVLVEIPDDVHEAILLDVHSSDFTAEVARPLGPNVQSLNKN